MGARGYCINNSNEYYLYNYATSSTDFIVKADGNVGIGTNAPATNLHVLGTAAGSTFKFVDGNGRTLQDLGGGILSWSAASVFGSASWGSTADFEINSLTGGRQTLQVNGAAGASHSLRVTGATTAGTPTAWIHNSNNTAGADCLVVSSVSENDAEVFAVRTNTTTFGGGDTDFGIVKLVSNSPRVGIGIRLQGYSAGGSGNYHDIVSYGDNLTFYRNSTMCLFLLQRYVGIGTTAPGYKRLRYEWLPLQNFKLMVENLIFLIQNDVMQTMEDALIMIMVITAQTILGFHIQADRLVTVIMAKSASGLLRQRRSITSQWVQTVFDDSTDAGATSITFEGFGYIGFLREGANIIGVTTGGSNRWSIGNGSMTSDHGWSENSSNQWY